MITRRMAIEGQFLFRYRSFLPLLFILPLAWSMLDYGYLNNSRVVEQYWLWFCFSVSVSGLLLRVTTVGFVPEGTSGRNTHSQIAEELNVSGWYSVCRNPLYLGNFLIALGFILVSHDASVTLFFITAFWLYYERIIAAEEAFLADKFGTSYAEWADTTPVFVPAFSKWRRPAMHFCTRTVLRREYPAVLLIGAMFFILNGVESWMVEQRFSVDKPWIIVFGVCAAFFLIARSLKKHTTMLRVSGR